MIRLAGSSWSGDFGMANSKKEWPEYSIGQKEHLHAISVLAFNFNEFEAELFEIFVHHLDLHNVPRGTPVKMYYEMTGRRQLDFIKLVFSIYEEDSQVRATLSKLLKYFDWCADTRNRLIHAQYKPPLFGKPDNKLYLAKRASQRSTKLHHMKPSLCTLQNAADKVRLGATRCLSLRFYLNCRDTPQSEWNVTMRVAFGLADKSLPEIPPPPKKLQKSIRPHTPPLPQFQLQSRHRSRQAG